MRLGRSLACEDALDPVELGVAALGVDVADAELAGQPREDLVVGLALAQRLDALLLEHDERGGCTCSNLCMP